MLAGERVGQGGWVTFSKGRLWQRIDQRGKTIFFVVACNNLNELIWFGLRIARAIRVLLNRWLARGVGC